MLPEGSAFPYDFGFIPSTLGEDGDPLDVLVLMDAPAPVGCVLTVRLIGVIEAKQRDKDKEWIENDRLLAIATHAHEHGDIKHLSDLPPRLLDEIEAFFGNYNALHGKERTRRPLGSEEGCKARPRRRWQIQQAVGPVGRHMRSPEAAFGMGPTSTRHM